MQKQSMIPTKYPAILLGITVLLGLYLTSLYNYLLFHSLAEIFSIIVACGIFMVAWNSQRFLDNNYLLYIGIAYLFVGGLDLLHTLAYKGMGVFQGYETNLPTQLWISARYMESVSLLIAPLWLGRKFKKNLVLIGYTTATSLLLISIFYWKSFPVCFIEGSGLTPFKKISEYIISFILLASIVLLLKNRNQFDRVVLQWVIWSIIITIVSELAFTFYVDAYGLSNLIGHFLKIVSFYLIYKAIIETGLKKPYDLLFRNLKQSEERFRNIFEESPIGIELYDPRGQLLEVNKACLGMFGISDTTQVKRFKLFEDPNLSEKVKEDLEKGEVIKYQAPFDFEKVREHRLYETTKSGAIYLDVLITPLTPEQKEGHSGFLVQVQDITERKEMEEALRRSHAELEERVQQRTAELARVNEDLQAEIAERKQAEKALQKSEQQLRFLSSQLLTAQERERKRIARELHDGLGQSLTAVKFRVENFLQEMDKGGVEAKAQHLKVIIPIIQESIEEARRIQMDLRPSILDDLGILPTIEWFCRQFQITYSSIRIEKEINIQEDKVPDLLRTEIYRISQEALNNVAKHSKANLVCLTLGESRGEIELVIKDNGQGFDPKEALSRESTKRGLGLSSMKERTELSGGNFVIESTPGKGTTIRAHWPRK
jgi:PAS domain S-box-containing protein